MLKALISLSVLTTGFSVTPVLTNIQNINIKNQNIDSESIQYVNKNILIDNTQSSIGTLNEQPQSGSEDLQLKGPNTDTRYRILMNSNGNKVLPNLGEEPKDDYLIGKGNKDDWYNHLIKGLTINVTQYASSKTEFLNKYRAITFSYFYMINFWNTWYDWTYQYGKSGPLLTDTATYALTGSDFTKTIFEKMDPNHDNNERAKLVVFQKWNGNILNYSFYLSVWYHWKWGSNVDHAVTASFKGDEYTFTSAPINERYKEAKIDKLKVYSTFVLDSYTREVTTNKIDTEIKKKAQEENVKNASFKTAAIMVQGYYGSKRVGNTIYIYSLIIRWSPQSGVATRDSTLLLNGVDLTRSISTVSSNGQYHFNYENSFGDKQESTDFSLRSELNGVTMEGDFHLPYVYI